MTNYNQLIRKHSLAIDLNKEDPLAYKNRGDAYVGFGDSLGGYIIAYKNAISDYTKVLTLSPSAEVYKKRGDVFSLLGETESATNDYNSAETIIQSDSQSHNNFQNDPKVYYKQGVSNYDLKEYEKAIVNFNEAIEIDPGFTGAYYNRGLSYYYLNVPESAIADFNKVIQLDSKIANVYNMRGLSYYDLNEHEKSIADYDKSIELNPNASWIYTNRANSYDSIGESKKALEDYSKSLEIDPDNAWTY